MNEWHTEPLTFNLSHYNGCYRLFFKLYSLFFILYVSETLVVSYHRKRHNQMNEGELKVSQIFYEVQVDFNKLLAR